MKNYLKTSIIVLLVLALSLSACVKNEDKTETPQTSSVTDADVDTGTEQISEFDEITNEATADNAASGESALNSAEGEKKVITLSLCWDYYIEEAADRFMKLHPDVEIKINSYSGEMVKYMTQVPASLMAGNADDILDGFGVSFQNPSTVKLLADFYPLMQADQSFNEDDYFTNVFKALEYKGGLYIFPISFTYNLVAVNNRVQGNLRDKFSQYSHLNSFDLMDIYKSMQAENDSNIAGYYLHDSFDVNNAFYSLKDSFIDVENKTCDFNNERFINFLNEAKSITDPEKEYLYSNNGIVYSQENEEARSNKYLFQIFSADSFQYILEFEEGMPFGDPVPFTNGHGQINITPLKNFCINGNSENKELAWEFLKFMADGEDTDSSEGYPFIPPIPVNKKVLTDRYMIEVPKRINGYEKDFGWHIKGDLETASKKVISLTNEFNNMPMYFYNDFGLNGLISDPLAQFNDGQMTAEQIASELQNKMSLYLME